MMKQAHKKLGKAWVWGVLVTALGLVTPVQAAEDATLYWSGVTRIGTTVSGSIERVAAVGQRVKAGDELLRFQQDVFQAHVNFLQAEVKGERELSQEAVREDERAQQLYEQTMLSEHDLTMAKLGRIRAEASYQSALARLQDARFAQQQSIILAPFNAIVLAVGTTAGEVVNSAVAAPVLLQIARSDQLLARAQIDLATALTLRPGAPARVKFGGQNITGTIIAVGLTESTSVGGEVAVDVTFPIEVGAKAYPGMKASIELR